MVVAFLLALLSAFAVSGRLSGGKLNHERIIYTLVLSFVQLFASGIFLNLFNQIGMIQLVLVNAAVLGVVLLKLKSVDVGKIELDAIDCAIVLVFLFGFFVRAYPILSDPLPFGSYDIIQHYSMAMETYERGGVPNGFPKYLNWYGTSQDNVNGVWIYPPGNAIMSAVNKHVFGLSWPYTIHLFSAIFDSLTILIIYAIATNLIKSKGTGLVAGALVAVSGKNIFSLYFGQVAYEFGIMLATFALMAFISARHSGKRFVAVSGVAGGLSFLVSPLAAGYFVFSSLMISLADWSDSKKVSGMKTFAYAIAAMVLVSAFFLPKFALWFSFFGARSENAQDSFSALDLIWPAKMIQKSPGLPGWYFDPSVTMGVPWLVLLAVGLVLLVYTKMDNKKTLVAWFVADYILTHSYAVWGPLGFSILYDYAGRWMAQSMIAMALLAGLMGSYAIGHKDGKITFSKHAGFAFAFVLLVLIAFYYAPDKLDTAKSVYAGSYRITPEVFSLLGDVRKDTTEGSAMLVVSPSVQIADERRGLIEAFTKTRVYTQPTIANNTLNLVFTHNYTTGIIDYHTRYIMFDYSGFAKTTQFSGYVNGMKNFESQLFGTTTPAFYNNEVRIYKME